MPRIGRPFENLIQRIERALEPQDCVIISPGYLNDIDSGEPREVDVLISFPNLPHPFQIALECRDRKGNEDVTWIEQLIEKKKSVKVDKVIAVSSSGFSPSALLKAQNNNILTLNLAKLPPNVEQVILNKNMRIQHQHTDTEDVQIFIDEKQQHLLERLKQESVDIKMHEIKLYKMDHTFWGTVGLLLSKSVSNDEFSKLDEHQKASKTVSIDFGLSEGHLFVKLGEVYIQINKIESLIKYYWTQQDIVFDSTYLYDSSNNDSILAKHAEAAFDYLGKRIVFSLTKKGVDTIAQVEVSPDGSTSSVVQVDIHPSELGI